MLAWYVLAIVSCLGIKNVYEKTMAFRPTLISAALTVILILYCTLCLSNVSVFLYFNF